MNYKQFPQRELISEWDKLLKLSREDVLSLYEQWKVTEEQNKSLSKQMYEEKNAKIKKSKATKKPNKHTNSIICLITFLMLVSFIFIS